MAFTQFLLQCHQNKVVSSGGENCLVRLERHGWLIQDNTRWAGFLILLSADCPIHRWTRGNQNQVESVWTHTSQRGELDNDPSRLTRTRGVSGGQTHATGSGRRPLESPRVTNAAQNYAHCLNEKPAFFKSSLRITWFEGQRCHFAIKRPVYLRQTSQHFMNRINR